MGHHRRFTKIKGSVMQKSLSGLVIPTEEDELFEVLKATIEDVAELMSLPSSISEDELKNAIAQASQNGVVSIESSGATLVVKPAKRLLKAMKLANKLPADQYKQQSIVMELNNHYFIK